MRFIKRFPPTRIGRTNRVLTTAKLGGVQDLVSVDENGAKCARQYPDISFYSNGLHRHLICLENSMSKTMLPVLTLNLLVLGLVARLREVLESKIPLGYQDETGFHFGVKR